MAAITEVSIGKNQAPIDILSVRRLRRLCLNQVSR